MEPLRTSLQVATDPSHRVIALIRYENIADFDVFILNDPPPIFIESNGAEIRNIGPSEKRRPYTLDDYKRLPPQGQIVFRVDLTDLYAWKPGSHEYEASITGDYTDPVDHRQWKSPWVTAKFLWSK